MWTFWDDVIQPVLSAAEVRTVVEVGAATGLTTIPLVNWAAANRAVVHVIDPMPLFDVEAVEREFPDTFVMHRAPSLEALPLVKQPDAVLIDGDHNWYTVSEELRLLDRISRLWPITLLHDVGWPYGRRDMYYQPDSIPSDYRQPYQRSGIVPGCSRLSPDGVNSDLANAAHEGGPRNGVLTAVEDFMDEASHNLELFAVTGGLGLLIDRDRLETEVGRVVKRAYDQSFGLQLSPRYVSRYFDQ